MLSLLLRPVRQAVKVLVANESPRQIAAGVAIGAVLGLVPKGNLIAVSLAVMLFALRVNKPAGLASAALFSWLSFWLDPFSERLGEKLLAARNFQDTFVWLYDQPLGPWIGFHNTVVIGSLLVGVYLAYPIYLATELVFRSYGERVAKWLLRYKIARALLGLDISSRFGAATLGGGS